MLRLGVFTTICVVLASPTWAVEPAAAAGATVVVPDHFLRRWDPVTVFFPADRGPAKGGPEDHPERFATFAPAHPGAFRWLDARTLQFRPAEPWPSLARFTWTVDGKPFVLTTLMAAPLQTLPSDGSEGLEAVGEVALTFPEPLDVQALSRMTTLELRPLPGIDGSRARWLTGADFDVKAVERASRVDKATYVLALHQPIPLGTRAVVHLRLSLDDKESESFKEVSFSTAEPFRVVGLGCRGREYPVTPDGTRYTREQAIRCDGPRRAVAIEFSSAPDGARPGAGPQPRALHARGLQRLLRSPGQDPRGRGGLRVGDALLGASGRRARRSRNRGCPGTRLADGRAERAVRVLPAQAGLREVGSEPGHRRALRRPDGARPGAGGRAPRSPDPAGRASRPLLLALPRAARGGRRVAASAGSRRAAGPLPGPRSVDHGRGARPADREPGLPARLGAGDRCP